MKGNIKYAKVSIKYNESKGRTKSEVSTKPVKILIVVKETENKRTLKFKTAAIKRVCQEAKLNYNKLRDPDINSIEIIKDLGKTIYDV